MKETMGSLRLYCILVGGFALIWAMILSLLNVSFFANGDVGVGLAFLIITVPSVGISGLYLWMGISLQTILKERPHIPMRLSVVAAVLSFLTGNVLGALLNIYIYYQLKRLAREMGPELEEQVLR